MPNEELPLDIKKLLDSINVEPVKNAAPVPDSQTKAERIDLEYERKKIELDHLRDHFLQRKKFARNIFYLNCAWIFSVFGLLLLDGFGLWGFHLSDSIILAAVGTTTANILGVLLIVTKYFFPSPQPPTQSTQDSN